MTHITEAEAKLFFELAAKDFAPEFKIIPAHVAQVVEIAGIMARKDGLPIAQARAAAWLHDCGYKFGQKDHAARSLEMAKEAGLALTMEMEDAIANHGSKAQPITPLGKLMKRADKLSILNPQMIEDFYPDHMNELKMWCQWAVDVI